MFCGECKEKYCDVCAKRHVAYKAFKDHRLSPIEHYRYLKNISEDLTRCKLHNKEFQHYCNKHNSPVCIICIQKSHNDCPEPIKINQVDRKHLHDQIECEFKSIENTSLEHQLTENERSIDVESEAIKNSFSEATTIYLQKVEQVIEKRKQKIKNEVISSRNRAVEKLQKKSKKDTFFVG